MYQNVYGGQGGNFPSLFLPGGLPFPAFVSFQPGLLFGQQFQGVGPAQFQGPVQQPMHGQYGQYGLQLGIQQPPAPPPQTYGHRWSPPRQPEESSRGHDFLAGGDGSRDDRRRRHFTEAPGGQPGDNKQPTIIAGPTGTYDDELSRRRFEAAAAQRPSQGATGEWRSGGGSGGGGGGDGGWEWEERRGGDGWRNRGGTGRATGGGGQYSRHYQQQQQQRAGQRGHYDMGQQRQQQQQPASNAAGKRAAGGQDSRSNNAAARALSPTDAAAKPNAGAPAGGGAAALEVATAAAAGRNNRSRPQQRHIYTVLGRNIQDLVGQLSPTSQEVRAKEQVLHLVRQAAQAAFPEYQGVMRVEPFGSYMCGLGTKSSDIDVVLVGLAEPSLSLGFYSKGERPRIARLLDRLTPHLRSRLRVTKLIAVRHARVPILKITTSAGISVDISIAGMSGPQAAEYIRQQVSSFPALRPLVLVLKSYMRELDLAEVAKGGISSYGLTYMVMAHLMEESRRGADSTDLGALLHSLMRRYGRSFDMSTMAVSVRHGGLVPRGQLVCSNAEHSDRIVTIDPLTGRNITDGTFRSDEVLDAFSRADAYLTAWAARRDEDVPLDADILAPLVTSVPDEDDEQYVQEYAPPANGAQLGKRGRSQELAGGCT